MFQIIMYLSMSLIPKGKREKRKDRYQMDGEGDAHHPKRQPHGSELLSRPLTKHEIIDAKPKTVCLKKRDKEKEKEANRRTSHRPKEQTLNDPIDPPSSPEVVPWN